MNTACDPVFCSPLTVPLEPAADARRTARIAIARPILAIPLFPNDRPDEANRFAGHTVNLGADGVLFETDLPRPPISNRLVLGVEVRDGDWAFATIEVRRTERGESDGRLRIGARFAPESREVFRPSNLEPALNPQTHRLETGLALDTLRLWEQLGVLRPMPTDSVLVCPQCGAVPTARRGCTACGSPRVAATDMIHHYACAYVGSAAEFERDGELACPKCRARPLVVGADFEHLTGPFHCGDCGTCDTRLELVGRCRACELEFPLDHCPEQELLAYDVHRLDPLALVAAA